MSDEFADMIEDALGPQSCETKWVRGPRMMGLPGYIRNTAKSVGVELISMEVKQNIFMLEASYSVRGPKRKVDAFLARIDAGFKAFGALEQR